MNELHSLLKRQLRRFADETLPHMEEQTAFLRAINDAYWQFDADRRMLEHSLELTSQELLERNAELSRINMELEMRVAARTAELSSSEARFRGLFEYAPVSIWEEDFSAVREYIDNLRAAGVVDFSAHFDAHPEAVAECATRVKVVDVNLATLEMYQADSKARLLADLSQVLGAESLIPFKEELLALARGDTSFENETTNYTLGGESRIIFLRLTVAPGCEETWAQVFVGISDITERRQAEAALERSERMFRALFDLSPDAVLVIDPHDPDVSWPIIDCNLAACLMNGYRREELIGQSIDILNISASTEDERIAYMNQLREAGHLKLEASHRRKDGVVFPLEISTTIITVGDRELVIGIDRDVTDRKQAEEALRQSEAEMRALFAAMHDVVMVFDREGRYVQIAPTSSQQMYRSPGEMLGKTTFDVLPPTLANTIYTAIQDVLRTQRSIHVEYPLELDGEVVWKDALVSPRTSDTVFWIAHDITPRKQAEEALRQSEQKYRTLVQNMPAIIYIDVADEPHNTIYINPQVQEILGYAPEDWIATPDLCNDIVHPEDSQRMWKEAQEAQARGRFACDYRYIAKDGHVVWVHDEAILLKGEGEAPSVWQGVMLDITPQKEAEEALRQSEERFRLMSWATKDAVWDWDLNSNQIWWGEGLQKILHYPSDAAQPNPEWRLDHIHPEDAPRVNRVISQALEGGMEFWSKEYRFRRTDGTYADIMDRGYILRNDTGKPYRMIGAMMDITERKQNEETIRHQNEMLSSLYQITLDLLRYREIDPLLKALVELSAKFLDAPFTEIMLVEGETLVVRATTHNQPGLIGEHISRGDALLSWQAFDTHEPAVLGDYAAWPHRRPIYDEFQLHAVADFPILNDNQCLGVMSLGRDRSDYEFTRDQVQFGRLFANLTALVLNNAQLREALHEQSIRDPLTGLYNRRYMEEMFRQHLSRVTRQLHPLGIIMIDIDHFKRFNDTCGHAAGDALLRELGRFLQSRIRLEDIACRYGGEEFMLILPDASLEVAQRRAEQLREEAKGLRARDAGQTIKGITLSMGVAVYPQHGRTKESVLRAADAALYLAKQQGRDRVIVAETLD